LGIEDLRVSKYLISKTGVWCMRTLNDFIPRNLGARKSRTLLTVLGIALGVAAMVATSVVRESASRSLIEMFDHAAGRADLAVSSAAAGIVGGEGFEAAALEQIEAVEGVEMAAPLVQATTLPTAQLEDWEYPLIAGNFSGPVVYGVDPQASRDMGHYRLAAGDDLDAASDDAILLTESYAKTLGLSLGDELELVAPTGQVRFRVVGLLASEGLARLNMGQVGVTTLATVQRAFERAGRLDQVDVVAAPGVDSETLQIRLEAALGNALRVFYPASKGELVDRLLQSILSGMGLIGIVALVVGTFLIYNTFATTVAERTRELGLLHALGAGRGQIVRLVLAEVAAMGLLGAGLGVLLGIGMADGMGRVAGAMINNEVSRLVVLPKHVLSGLAIGVVLALMAGLVPALRAGRLPVVEAIQQRRRGDGRASRRQVLVGMVLTVSGLAVTAVHAIRPHAIEPIEATFELAYLAVIAVLIGVGLLLPVAIPRLAQLAGAALGRLGAEGQLGGRNLARSPGRAALTAGALMFGLASVVIIGGVVSSATEMSQEYMNKTLASELWVSTPQPLPRSQLTAEFEALPGVELVGSGASLPTRLVLPDQTELPIVFTVFDPRRLEKGSYLFASDGGTQEEAAARLTAGGAVMISGPLREWYGLDLGDTVRLQTAEGVVGFEVAGVIFDVTASGYAVQGVWKDANRYFGTDQANIFAVDLAPGADPATVAKRILQGWGDTYNLRIENQEDFVARARSLTDSYFALNNAAVLVSVLVAALGVVNTLLMNVLERRREIGMLRSLGMTRGQVVRLILSESAAMGLLGGVLGVMLGVWLLRYTLDSTASVSGYRSLLYVFPLQAVVTCVVIALVVPPLAGLWPAWQGARANIVEALSSE
jgi:putative ABC transport system permease protein